MTGPPNRRFLVTGGAGFLGSHLCEALLARGDRVVCVDNLSTGRLENIAPLLSDPAFEWHQQDVSCALEVEEPLHGVLHFASPASPPDYLRLPLETMAAGSEGTRQCLSLAARHRARLVLASSSEVYGQPSQHPQPETYWGEVNPVGPRSVYDEAKRFSEALCMAWHRSRGVDVAILRIFNTYGPRLRPDDGRVVSTFLSQALSGSPVTVHGAGTQTRSLCYVTDLVRGVLAMLDSPELGPINLGNPQEITVGRLAELVLEITGSCSGIEHLPLPEDEPSRRCPDIRLAERVLGWRPSVTLADGLRLTAQWMGAQQANPGGACLPRAGGRRVS